jgi:hypothetical protein
MANPVVFRRSINIGAADAEADNAFLDDCFVDTGDIATLMDCSNSQCIVVGRTGAGKTALLRELKLRAEHSIELSPENMALSYIANSKAIAFYEEAGVHMEILYKAMWQHVLVIELLKLKYDVKNDERREDMFARLFRMFSSDHAKTQAMEYVQTYGGTFWRETAERTKGIVERVETELKASAKVDVSKISLGAEGAQKLSVEERGDVVMIGERAVSQLQLEKLNGALKLLREDVFADDENNYFVVIDRLDEDWVKEPMKLKLIRALIEAVRSLRQVSNVKIVFSLRDDLLHSVLEKTASPGFQREKFTSLYLRMRWTRQQILELLDKRISSLFRRQYTKDNVTLSDILPGNQVHQRKMADYIIDRTFMRPREAIVLVNECISQADGESRITKSIILQAEGIYSGGRMDALVDEWGREFPQLRHYLEPFRRTSMPMRVSELNKDAFEPMCLKILEFDKAGADPLYPYVIQFYIDGTMDRLAFVRCWLEKLYRFGAVGVKPNSYYPRMWSFEHEQSLPTDLIDDETSVDVHKAFWREYGIKSTSYTDEAA